MADPHEQDRFEFPPVTVRQAPMLALKGLCMGTADIIPGVSGGTVALILNVYRRLIEALRSFTPSRVLALLRAVPGLWSASRRPELWSAARAVHLDFLIPLGSGILLAILLAARIIPGLLERYPAQMNALFFGLISASVYVPVARMPQRRGVHLVAALFMAALAYWVVGLPFATGDGGGLPGISLAGAIAICAMILPGLSGSYLLKAMGKYEVVLGALNDVDLAVLGALILGMVVGILAFVRVLSWLLRHHESLTLAVLAGLMVGSLRSVWPVRAPGVGEATVAVWPDGLGRPELLLVGIVLLGVAIVVALIQADRRLGHDPTAAQH